MPQRHWGRDMLKTQNNFVRTNRKGAMDPFGHIGVLMGGFSSERDISLKSGHAVIRSLRDCGRRVSAIDVTQESLKEIKSFIQGAGPLSLV